MASRWTEDNMLGIFSYPYPMAISSTISTGCMMSVLHLGIAITCSFSPTSKSAQRSALFTPFVTAREDTRLPPIL